MAAVRYVRARTRSDRELEDVHVALMLLADRELIAREVNAGVIHTLFEIGLHLQGAVERATEDGAKKAMERAVAEIDEAIAQLRREVFRHGSALPQS